MSVGAAPKPRFEPVHEGHAIEQVVTIVQFNRELIADRLPVMEKLGAERLTDLPKQATLQQLLLAIGPTAPAIQPNVGPTGIVFQRIRPDGVVETELKIDRLAMTFRTLFYTRWADIWGKARTYFEMFLPFYREAGEIHSIGLHYSDKFVWKGPIEVANAATLFRPNSPYLAPHVYGVTDLWHSHTGAFLRHDRQTKRLLNVDVDVLDEPAGAPQRRVVSIRTALTDSFNQVGFEVLDLGPDPNLAIAFLDTHMNNLHDSEKAVLADVLSEEMCRRIQLGAANE